MPVESVEIAIEGFSGPLDLLCHLVESRQMQASKIKMAQLVRIYGAYLSKTKKASVDMLAEFFFMAASLLLQKTLSLLPGAGQEIREEYDEDSMPLDEEEMLARLERYRPYRSATLWLMERKIRRERCYRRIVPEEPLEPEQKDLRYDIGDLYFLSRIWWGILEKSSRSERRLDFPFDFEEEWNGVPEALPDESQIQSRVAELEEKLEENGELSLTELWSLSPSVKVLVVTLLAILEMCRMGKILVKQEVLFSDVKIRAKNR